MYLQDGGISTVESFLMLSDDEKGAVYDFLGDASVYETIEYDEHTAFIFGRMDYSKRYYQDENTYIITGHTPTFYIEDDFFAKKNKKPEIYAANGHNAIDCGCVYGGRLADKIIVLAGNHEDMACDGRWPIGEERFFGAGVDNDDNDDRYITWMQNLRRYYVEGDTIFVHAGVDEEADDLWEWGTDDYTFTEKYPAQTGKFCMNIVAGHIGTEEISGDTYFHDIYYDGESHYYIDGTVLDSGIIPIIKLDTDSNKFYRVTETGDWLILPYGEEN